MKCKVCGTELADGALLCPNCGRVLTAEDKAVGGKLTKKEFYQLPGMKSCRSNITSCAVILYVCAGITVLATFFLDGFLASLLDAAVILALGLWLHLGKSRIAAILTTCYGLFGVVVALIQVGKIQGWWIPLAGIWAIIYTFKFQNLWKKYQQDGVLPQEAMGDKK